MCPTSLVGLQNDKYPVPVQSGMRPRHETRGGGGLGQGALAMSGTDETAKPPQLLAIGLIQDAQTYLDSARLLSKEVGSAVRFFPPIYFLLCQAMELVLKAYLAASGVPNRTLREEIGHNLDLGFRHGREHGFDPADARFPELVRWLGPFHLDHSFRYRKSGRLLQLPLASEAAEIIGNTLGPIEHYVRRQFIKMRSRESRRAVG